MNTDEKILKALENLQTDVAALRAGQKTLETGQQTLELKVGTIHEYQKKAHGEIMGSLFESNETTGRAQKVLEKRIERIEKHLGLSPVK